MRASKRDKLKALLIVFCVAALIVGGYLLARYFETRGTEEVRGELESDFDTGLRIEYEGRNYRKKHDITTVLIIGVDKEDISETGGYRSGGQADFLLLNVIDNDTKQIRQLQIDRDTMTNISVLGVLGQPVGTRFSQICLAHVFGKTEQEHCEYTMEAVKNLLQGTEIDLVVAVDLDFISTLNDAAGGVTVTLDEDFSVYDKQMTKGSTLTLNGKQAELYVRSRRNLSDISNRARSERQRAYLSALAQKIRSQSSEDAMFISRFYDAISPYIVTNAAKGRLINELNTVWNYKNIGIETLEGEYTKGSDGFTQFNVDEKAVTKWVLDVFYNEE